MIAGQRPFLTLGNGTSIDLSSLLRFYGSIPLSEEDQASLADLLDEEAQRLRFINRLIDRIYALPGFVIPYP